METNNIIEQKLRIYQNANNTPESIKQNFVIRTHEYELIIEDLLKKKRNDSIQHELILGRRGSGKSTLLKRIQIEIDENVTLQKKYVAINLPEEQGRIYRLFDLWETVYDELCERYSIQNSKKDFDEFEDDKEYTNYIFGLLHEVLDKKKLIAVLLLDNFDRILDNIKEYANILRETLLNYNDIKIIAGSTRMAEHFWKYDYPFYEFFRTHRLGALASEEIKTLLKHWSKILEMPQLENFIYEKPGQLEAIRILTDGLPRTLQFFIKILIEHNYQNGYDYLNHIFDKVSPLYQERLDKLTPSHRKIVMEMAFIWHGCTVQQLVDKCKMESKLISANLKQLDQYGIVETRKTEKKNNIYLLAERFFNIWLLGTQGNPSERRKAKYLTIFLENFYSRDELKELAINHIKKLQNKELDYDKALLHSKALAQSKHITTKERDRIIELTENLGNEIMDCKIELPEKTSAIYKKILNLIDNKNYKDALLLVNDIDQEEDGVKDLISGIILSNKENIKDAEKCYLLSIKKGNIDAAFNVALLYEDQRKFDKAEEYYLLAIENNDTDAIFNLALMYEDLKKINKAEKYYLLAIEKNENKALNNLALLYENEQKYDKAEKYYLLGIKKNDNKALNNLAILYKNQNKIDIAEKYFLLAIDKGNADAIFNLALLYVYQQKYNKAEKYYLLAIKNDEKRALNNLGLLYEEQKKYDKAEKYYLLAIEEGDNKALHNLALLYESQKNYKKAEKYYLKAIEKENVNSYYNLAMLYEDQHKIDLAQKYYLLAIEKGQIDAINNLALLYFLNKEKEKLNHFLEKYNHDSDDFRNLKFISSIWNGKMNNIFIDAKQLILQAEYNNTNFLLINLLIHHQQNIVQQLFDDSEIGKKLMERYIPIYYATLLLKNKQDVITLTIPSEIKVAVEDIIKMVKNSQKYYYP
ncbi:MAG: tetratricopeptide repeat protein [Chitinophagales bacterium]